LQQSLNDSSVTRDISGVVFLDKPKGWTSRQAVSAVVRLFSVEGEKPIKAGHAGTLDPLATGMLPIMLGEATRFSTMGLDADKTYRVTLDLGYQTDTLDAEGEITGRFKVKLKQADVEAVLPRFTGKIEQRPPAYSAIHVNGERAHKIMREGGHVELPARPVTIHALKFVSFASPLLTLEVHCSKGTYVRSLARDIGEALGTGGCVTELRRLSTAGWPELMMVTFEQLEAQPETCLLPLPQWLRHLPRLKLRMPDAIRYAQGQRIQLSRGDEGDYAVFCAENPSDPGAEPMLLGTGRIRPGTQRMILHPLRVLPSVLPRLMALNPEK
jgi:tRNA pseudouridine55 synthase